MTTTFTSTNEVLIGGHLTLSEFISICRLGALVKADEIACAKLRETRKKIDDVIDSNPEAVYGLNTGLGSLMRVKLSRDELTQFSRNVILSHSSGVGTPFPEDVVRGIMLLEANSFLKGYSGVHAEIPITLIQMLNSCVHPYIPSQGSLGASGDLAPLAHMSLVATRDLNDDDNNSGRAYFQGKLLPGHEAMRSAGVDRIVLGPKEGLSMVNGTHVTTALLALALWDAKIIIRSIDIIAAMSLEALRGRSAAYDLRIHALRPYAGQIRSVNNINRMVAGSKLLDSRHEVVQDPYAYRCTPQVHGACRSALNYIEDVVNTELNAVTDSPLVFDSDNNIQLLSGGNFHAEPLGYAADTLGLAMAGLGTLSERRGYRLTVNMLSRGLPSYLVDNPGINSGMMIAQYTAASLASENKVLSHPSTVDSITVAEDQEDHVSMATTAARKALSINENVSRICAVELLCAAQAINFRLREEKSDQIIGIGTKAAFDVVREEIPFLERDKVLADDIDVAKNIILSEKLINAVEIAIGTALE